MDAQDPGSLGISPQALQKLMQTNFQGQPGKGTNTTADPMSQLILRILQQMPQSGGYSPSPGVQMPGGFTPSPGLQLPGGFTPSPGIQGPPGYGGPPGNLGLPSGGQSAFSGGIDPSKLGPGPTPDMREGEWGQLQRGHMQGPYKYPIGPFTPGQGNLSPESGGALDYFANLSGGRDPLSSTSYGILPGDRSSVQGRPGSPSGDNRYNFSGDIPDLGPGPTPDLQKGEWETQRNLRPDVRFGRQPTDSIYIPDSGGMEAIRDPGPYPSRQFAPIFRGSRSTIQGRPGSPPGDNRYNYTAPDFANPEQFGTQAGPLDTGDYRARGQGGELGGMITRTPLPYLLGHPDSDWVKEQGPYGPGVTDIPSGAQMNYQAPDLNDPEYQRQRTPLGMYPGDESKWLLDLNPNSAVVLDDGGDTFPEGDWRKLDAPTLDPYRQSNYQSPPQQQLSPAVMQYLQQMLASQAGMQRPGRPF